MLLEHSVLQAAIKYNLNRQFVYRQLKKWEGRVESLASKSRHPHNSPNAHTEEELELKHCIEFPSHGKKYYQILANLRQLLGLPIK